MYLMQGMCWKAGPGPLSFFHLRFLLRLFSKEWYELN